jgi:hypothetical protein
MSQILLPLIAGHAIRFLLVLVYLSIGVAAVILRARLGAATAPAALGSASLALGNIIGIAGYFWQISASLAGREALRHIAVMVTLTNYISQSFSVIGAACLGYALFVDRPAQRPNWSGYPEKP